MVKRSPASGRNFLPFFAIFLAACALVASTAWAIDEKVRPAAVSGSFYPDSPSKLKLTVDGLLAEAPAPSIPGHIWGLVVPHAGYAYSGPVAASAYREIVGKPYKTVVLIGNSHRDSFNGIALYPEGAFETPLGRVEVDSAFAAKLLAANPLITARPSSHLGDHILEVQLPFLKRSLEDFKIVPIVFGSSSPELPAILATALAPLLSDETLVIASTDMSHYPPKRLAEAADKRTDEAILSKDPELLDRTLRELEASGIPNAETFLCGISAVKTLMLIGKTIPDEKVTLLKYANSADSSGESSRVVGYSALAFWRGNEASRELSNTAKDEELGPSDKQELLKIARRAVEDRVLRGSFYDPKVASAKLLEKRGVFVTLKKDGHLRGCIGRFEPLNVSLAYSTAQMATAAAVEDPRFRPVSKEELGELEYEISVLSPLKKVASADEIVLGRDGVEVRRSWQRGVFLPQVATEQGWDKETFLSTLCSEKAGLPADCWKDPDVELYVFTAQVFSEKE